MNCERDWFNVYGSRALDHFGRVTQPRVLTKDNAWTTRRDWSREGKFIEGSHHQDLHCRKI
jgi:hypothetical protein